MDITVDRRIFYGVRVRGTRRVYAAYKARGAGRNDISFYEVGILASYRTVREDVADDNRAVLKVNASFTGLNAVVESGAASRTKHHFVLSHEAVLAPRRNYFLVI